jgi:hypothetical protein
VGWENPGLSYPGNIYIVTLVHPGEEIQMDKSRLEIPDVQKLADGK